MKFKFLVVLCLSFFAFSFRVESQTSVPSSTSQPSATAPQKPSIPVVPVGDQVKPGKSSEDQTAKKTVSVSKVRSVPLILKETIYSKKSRSGDRVVFVLAGNLPNRGAPVIAKITTIERPRGNQPGQLNLQFEKIMTASGGAVPLPGTLQLTSAKDELGSYGREIFMPVNSKQSIANSSKIGFSGSYPSGKSSKHAAKGYTEDLVIKVNEGRTPGKINIYIEPPNNMKISDLKDDSLKLVRVNDFKLLQPVVSRAERGEVGDHNQNGIQDLGFVFDGWNVAKYLPQGNSTLTFLTSTRKGKPIEVAVKVNMEYR